MCELIKVEEKESVLTTIRIYRLVQGFPTFSTLGHT
jgi:hypothetical protein